MDTVHLSQPHAKMYSLEDSAQCALPNFYTATDCLLRILSLGFPIAQIKTLLLTGRLYSFV
ncbi:hypothetical protein BX600DRAFT_464874 [Xylariales sp. PMI_506]|nr:hypothetical protein BX600DRAFT_464874 [Xylariales sp. PMI_506]